MEPVSTFSARQDVRGDSDSAGSFGVVQAGHHTFRSQKLRDEMYRVEDKERDDARRNDVQWQDERIVRQMQASQDRYPLEVREQRG